MISGGMAQQRKNGGGEFSGVVWREVREFAPLEMSPEMLDGIQLGSVGRQVFELQSGIGGLESADGAATMSRPAIPDENDASALMPQDVTNEVGDAVLVEVLVGRGPEVQSESPTKRRQGQRGDEGDFIAMPATVQELWSLAARRQGAPHQRA